MKFLQIVKKIRHIYAILEDTLVGLFMICVILAAVGQIFCRWLHINGLVWADGFMRYSVLWIAMIGAAIAAREYQHITVDIPSLFIKGRGQNLFKGMTDLVAVAVSVLLVIASFGYWQEEREMGQIAFANISTATAMFVMPYCFAIIGLRFLIHGINHIISFIKPEPEDATSAPAAITESNS